MDKSTQQVTHQQCPQAAGNTHHLVPTGPAAARVMRCTYCHQSEAEIRAQI